MWLSWMCEIMFTFKIGLKKTPACRSSQFQISCWQLKKKISTFIFNICHASIWTIFVKLNPPPPQSSKHFPTWIQSNTKFMSPEARLLYKLAFTVLVLNQCWVHPSKLWQIMELILWLRWCFPSITR